MRCTRLPTASPLAKRQPTHSLLQDSELRQGHLTGLHQKLRHPVWSKVSSTPYCAGAGWPDGTLHGILGHQQQGQQSAHCLPAPWWAATRAAALQRPCTHAAARRPARARAPPWPCPGTRTGCPSAMEQQITDACCIAPCRASEQHAAHCMHHSSARGTCTAAAHTSAGWHLQGRDLQSC